MQPIIDGINDFTLLDLTEKDGYTRVKVSRKLKGGQPRVDRNIHVSISDSNIFKRRIKLLTYIF